MASLSESALAAGRNNVAFLATFLLGNVDGCLDQLVATGRLAEAAFFARS